MLDAGPDALPDADVACRYTLPCGIPDSGGFLLRGCEFFLYTADPDAGDASLGCVIPEANGCTGGVYTPPANGSVTFECLDCFGGGGRRPVGLLPARAARARDAVGDYFARMAHDEAASVHAFVRMQGELSRLGAPAELVAAAERSACDERRHALMRWQATHAAEPSLRRLFARVAADETRHAALSWEVARWAETRLDAPARARVQAARSRAVHALRKKLASRAELAPRSVVGQPRRDEALALLDGMIARLFA